MNTYVNVWVYFDCGYWNPGVLEKYTDAGGDHAFPNTRYHTSCHKHILHTFPKSLCKIIEVQQVFQLLEGMQGCP